MTKKNKFIHPYIEDFDKEFTQAEIGQPNNWKHEGISAKKLRKWLTEKLDSEFENGIDQGRIDMLAMLDKQGKLKKSNKH